MTVSTQTDKRFRRAHVRPARRRRLPRVATKHVVYASVLVAGLLYGGYGLVQYALSAEALIITRVTLSGGTALSADEVQSRLEGLRGLNMLTVDLEEWRQRVLESPWVETADLRRALPGGVDVRITERRPMGVGRVGRSLYLVDEQGVVIDEYRPSHGRFDLPLIDGLSGSRTASGSPPVVDERRAVLARRLLAALESRPDLADRVSQIDVTNPRDAVVILKGDTALVRVGEEQFVERLQAYIDVAGALRDNEPDIESVDLRFGDRLFVTPDRRRAPRKTAGGE